MFTIEMLHANEGDALWIEYGPDGGPVHRVLIDCGRSTAYSTVKDRLDAALAAGDPLDFDLVVLTHVDEDHIYGAVKLIADLRLSASQSADVWFNGWRHLNGETVPPSDALGAKQGEYFGAVLRDRRFAWNDKHGHAAVVVPENGDLPAFTLDGGMKITVLSPTWPRLAEMVTRWKSDLNKVDVNDPDYIAPGDWETALKRLEGEGRLHPDALGDEWLPEWDPDSFNDYAADPFYEDDSEPNGSSIALLAEYGEESALLSGDAFPTVLEASLKRLRAERGLRGRIPIDAFKLPHHGSKKNLSPDLVNLVKCDNWLVSTNGAKHHHPDPEAIARVIAGTSNPTIYFNFPSPEAKVWDSDDLRMRHGYRTVYGSQGCLKVTL